MKNSTLHRSNLSKEKIAFLEGLKSSQPAPMPKVVSNTTDAAPSVYVRPKKDKDLDVLWQSFKGHQREERSPGVYLTIGFIAGALFMFIVAAVLGLATATTHDTPVQPKVERKTRFGKALFTLPKKKAEPIVEAQSAPVVKNETYTVKTGDTLAGIVVRFYGSYDLAKVDKLLKVNNLSNPNKISIGQNLIIPMD